MQSIYERAEGTHCGPEAKTLNGHVVEHIAAHRVSLYVSDAERPELCEVFGSGGLALFVGTYSGGLVHGEILVGL